MGIEPRLIDLLVQIAWRGRGGSALHQSKPGRIHDGAIRVGFCAEQCIDTGLRIQSRPVGAVNLGKRFSNQFPDCYELVERLD